MGVDLGTMPKAAPFQHTKHKAPLARRNMCISNNGGGEGLESTKGLIHELSKLCLLPQ